MRKRKKQSDRSGERGQRSTSRSGKYYAFILARAGQHGDPVVNRKFSLTYADIFEHPLEAWHVNYFNCKKLTKKASLSQN